MRVSTNTSPFTGPVSLIKAQPGINQLASWPCTHSSLASSSPGYKRGTLRHQGHSVAPASGNRKALCLQACQSASPMPTVPAQSAFSPQHRLSPPGVCTALHLGQGLSFLTAQSPSHSGAPQHHPWRSGGAGTSHSLCCSWCWVGS